MKKYFLAITNLMLGFVLLQARNTAEIRVAGQQVNKLFFIENKGQWHSDVLFLCRMQGLDAWITRYGVNYGFYILEKKTSTDIEPKQNLPYGNFEGKNYNLIGHRVLMKLYNHNPHPTCESYQKQESYHNYFKGNDPEKYATNVRLYQEVIIKNIYNGIDIRYYFDRGCLRYDFIVHPGSDPTQILFSLEGSIKTYLNKKGNLVFTTRFGEVALAELKTYQEKDKRQVKSEFAIKNGKWTFNIDKYELSQTLIIDPLIYSTYLGGSSDDVGHDIFVDGSGRSYIAGFTLSADYDTTPGPYQISNGGYEDVFITKLNPSGSGLIYSTYLGGNNSDICHGLSVDASGNIYITGETFSTNYIVSPGAFQTTNAGGWDVFVTKLNASGNNILYSTYIGGSSNDHGKDIALDNSGHAFITGYTYSTNYDVTTGAYQTTISSVNSDIFVTKLNTSGTALVYSTYLGGIGEDRGEGIDIDDSGHAFVTGWVRSPDYDITPGAYQMTYGGGSIDAFVTQLNTTGTNLVYSTFLGGSSFDAAYDIEVDDNGNAYVIGNTFSANFDITSGAFKTSHGGGGQSDVFVTKINAAGSDLVYSTYLGGSNDDFGYAIAVDVSGQAYVTGWTWSTDYDITPGAYQTTNNGTIDAFLSKLDDTGTTLNYSTYLGGSDADMGFAIALNDSAYAYITGETWSTNFQISSGAFQTTYAGGWTDVFVTKMCPGVMMNMSLSSSPGSDNQTVCVNTSINNIIYNILGANAATVSGLPTGVNYTLLSNNLVISGQPTSPGSYPYSISLIGGCGKVTATGTIVVMQDNTIALSSAANTDNQTSCINHSITDITYAISGATGVNITGLPAGISSNFSGNSLTISGVPTVSGTHSYTVTLVGGCGNVSTSGSITVNVCTGIGEEHSSASWLIFPQPASGRFTIQTYDGGIFELVDITGRVINTYFLQKGAEQIEVNLPAGMYFMREKASSATHKLLIEYN